MRRASSRGFTLIELLVAVSLLAVLALLSWRGLDAVITARRQITAASDELQALVVAFAQIDEDLRRSWPVRLLALPEQAIQFRLATDASSITVEVLRTSTAGFEPTQLQRVSWRVRDGRLERGFTPWQRVDAVAAESRARSAAGRGAADAAAAAEQAGWVWQPVLQDVAQWSVQGWLTEQGWQAAEALAARTRGLPPGVLGPEVTGVLVRIVRQDGQVMQRVFPVRD